MTLNYKLVESEDEFYNIVNSTTYDHIVVNFGTTFCKSCKEFQPVYEKVSEKYKQIMFLKINADKVENIDQEYNITKWPTIIFLDRGNLKSPYSPYICYDKTQEKFEEQLKVLVEDISTWDDF